MFTPRPEKNTFPFQASLGLNLLFFNLMGALWLVGTEGIPIIITAYLIQVQFLK